MSVIMTVCEKLNSSQEWQGLEAAKDEQLLPGILNEVTETMSVMTLCEKANCHERWQGLEAAKDEELLPGISNDVTLNLIVPKLPWRAFRVLSSVSLAWLYAVRNHDVYRARVRSLSTDTLVVISYPLSKIMSGIALYSVNDNSYSKLPQIPGLPRFGESVSLDGKLYYLGGNVRSGNIRTTISREVYVLDLAGQRPWKRCASMITPREDFTCGVMDGKIYAFGGDYFCEDIFRLKETCESEVYDPKKNVWTRIKSKTSEHTGRVIATVGEEFVFYDRMGVEMGQYRADYIDMEAYRPLTNEWRVVKRFWKYHNGMVFHAQGKFHLVDGLDVYVHDDANSWAPSHHISLDAICPQVTYDRDIDSVSILVLEDQLLGIVNWDDYDCHAVLWTKTSLVQTTGLGGNNKEMEWKETNFLKSTEWDWKLAQLDFMCHVKL